MNSERNIQHSSGEDLPARIVAAARDCIGQFGFAKTSMHDIAGAAGMSAANLYRFYAGKLAIGSAVARAEHAHLLAACDAAVQAAGSSVSDRLIALFAANIELTRRNLKKNPRLFELGLIVARENRAVRQELLQAMEDRIAAILAGPPRNPALDSATLKVRSRLILMASAPFILPWMLLNEPFGDPRLMVEPLIHLLVPGVVLTAPGGRSPSVYRPA